LNDRGAKALVSSVRAYTKHEAAFIFRPTDLDYAALAAAFGLLRIPTMPEVRDWRKRGEKAAKKAADLAAKAKEDPSEENVAKAEAAAADVPIPVPWTDAEVDWDTYAYTDKAREAARKAAATEKAAKATDPEREKERAAERQKRKIRAELNGAWSVQKDRKVRKEERRDRKDARKQAEWERMRAEQGDEAAGAAPEPTARRAAKRKVEESSDDEEMDADYRSLKREVHEEKAAKKVNKSAKVAVGMFDDLD
jgi:ATP-dependent RNA helicase DDX55/SPB4